MRSAIAIILATSVLQGNTEELSLHNVHAVERFPGDLVDKIIDRLDGELAVRAVDFSHYDSLYNMTIGKQGHIATSLHGHYPQHAFQSMVPRLSMQRATVAVLPGSNGPPRSAIFVQAGAMDETNGLPREEQLKKLKAMYDGTRARTSPVVAKSNPSSVQERSSTPLETSREELLAMEKSMCRTMNVPELKKELAALGIDTRSFVEKDELVNALANVRVEASGKGSWNDQELKPPSSSSIVGPAQEALIAIERSYCQSLRIPELKAELEALGIDTRSFVEKGELVNALANARIVGSSRIKSSETLPPPQAKESLRGSRSKPGTSNTASPRTSAAASASYDVVVMRNPQQRSLFKSAVRSLRERKGWPVRVSTMWKLRQEEMDGRAGYIEQGNGYTDKDKDRLEEHETIPVVAINGRKDACAAALYSDAQLNDQNSFYLVSLIGSAGNQCKGAGSAILCSLIRRSIDKDGKFAPLKVHPIQNDPASKDYFKSFGCVHGNALFRGLDALTGYMPTFAPMSCNDPSPKKCEAYPDVSYDGDFYFTNIEGPAR